MPSRGARLAWLRPPKPGPAGSMSLGDHLRELRYRFLVSMAAILVTTALSLIFEAQLLQVVLWPIRQAVEVFQANRPGDSVEMVTQGITAGFSLYFRVCFVAGFIAACPVWLFQLWRFIVPALKYRERHTAVQFLGAAVPLFLIGVVLGYMICPRGFAMLLSFNPPSVVNLNDVGTFMSFELRLLLIFGLAFQLPVLLVSLNRLGMISGAALGKFRGPAVVLCGVFAAVATPTTDALTMLALMIPMVSMYLIAEVLCRLHDRRALALESGSQPALTRFGQMWSRRRPHSRSGSAEQ
ncbi:MAG: twin-arginine translocase subunit TatC [Propionibacteriaceae bacterium]|nr:twin-arginine translocase subunit TatC [Propionibacteriaceae bacterium]